MLILSLTTATIVAPQLALVFARIVSRLENSAARFLLNQTFLLKTLVNIYFVQKLGRGTKFAKIMVSADDEKRSKQQFENFSRVFSAFAYGRIAAAVAWRE